MPFVFAFRRRDFAYRRKVFCIKAQGLLRIGKSVLVPTFFPFTMNLAPTKPHPLTPEARQKRAITGCPACRWRIPTGCLASVIGTAQQTLQWGL